MLIYSRRFSTLWLMESHLQERTLRRQDTLFFWPVSSDRHLLFHLILIDVTASFKMLRGIYLVV
jgi:hypothetical protein